MKHKNLDSAQKKIFNPEKFIINKLKDMRFAAEPKKNECSTIEEFHKQCSDYDELTEIKLTDGSFHDKKINTRKKCISAFYKKLCHVQKFDQHDNTTA